MTEKVLFNVVTGELKRKNVEEEGKEKEEEEEEGKGGEDEGEEKEIKVNRKSLWVEISQFKRGLRYFDADLCLEEIFATILDGCIQRSVLVVAIKSNDLVDCKDAFYSLGGNAEGESKGFQKYSMGSEDASIFVLVQKAFSILYTSISNMHCEKHFINHSFYEFVLKLLLQYKFEPREMIMQMYLRFFVARVDKTIAWTHISVYKYYPDKEREKEVVGKLENYNDLLDLPSVVSVSLVFWKHLTRAQYLDCLNRILSKKHVTLDFWKIPDNSDRVQMFGEVIGYISASIKTAATGIVERLPVDETVIIPPLLATSLTIYCPRDTVIIDSWEPFFDAVSASKTLKRLAIGTLHLEQEMYGYNPHTPHDINSWFSSALEQNYLLTSVDVVFEHISAESRRLYSLYRERSLIEEIERFRIRLYCCLQRNQFLCWKNQKERLVDIALPLSSVARNCNFLLPSYVVLKIFNRVSAMEKSETLTKQTVSIPWPSKMLFTRFQKVAAIDSTLASIEKTFSKQKCLGKMICAK